VRDPRYAQSLIVVPLIPALILFYVGTSNSTGLLNAVGPIVAVLLAMSIYTDVSYDNTAFALHLQKGVAGRDDRLGRVVALAVFAVPVSLLLTIGAAALTNSWAILPALLGITIGVLLTGFAVSSVISGAFIFPVPVPGESPFKSKPGGGFSLMLSTFASWGVLAILVLPELGFAIAAFAGFAWAGWVSLAVGIVLGTVLLVIGIRLGGQILDSRGPELLSRLQAQK
jgi:ABC-2 type transport system permease protein